MKFVREKGKEKQSFLGRMIASIEETMKTKKTRYDHNIAGEQYMGVIMRHKFKGEWLEKDVDPEVVLRNAWRSEDFVFHLSNGDEIYVKKFADVDNTPLFLVNKTIGKFTPGQLDYVRRVKLCLFGSDMLDNLATMLRKEGKSVDEIKENLNRLVYYAVGPFVYVMTKDEILKKYKIEYITTAVSLVP